MLRPLVVDELEGHPELNCPYQSLEDILNDALATSVKDPGLECSMYFSDFCHNDREVIVNEYLQASDKEACINKFNTTMQSGGLTDIEIKYFIAYCKLSVLFKYASDQTNLSLSNDGVILQNELFHLDWEGIILAILKFSDNSLKQKLQCLISRLEIHGVIPFPTLFQKIAAWLDLVKNKNPTYIYETFEKDYEELTQFFPDLIESFRKAVNQYLATLNNVQFTPVTEGGNGKGKEENMEFQIMKDLLFQNSSSFEKLVIFFEQAMENPDTFPNQEFMEAIQDPKMFTEIVQSKEYSHGLYYECLFLKDNLDPAYGKALDIVYKIYQAQNEENVDARVKKLQTIFKELKAEFQGIQSSKIISDCVNHLFEVLNKRLAEDDLASGKNESDVFLKLYNNIKDIFPAIDMKDEEKLQDKESKKRKERDKNEDEPEVIEPKRQKQEEIIAFDSFRRNYTDMLIHIFRYLSIPELAIATSLDKYLYETCSQNSSFSSKLWKAHFDSYAGTDTSLIQQHLVFFPADPKIRNYRESTKNIVKWKKNQVEECSNQTLPSEVEEAKTDSLFKIG